MAAKNKRAEDLKVLVVGCGSIGRRHLGNLKLLGVKDFILCDTAGDMLDRAAEGLVRPVLTASFDDALGHKPDAAVVCTPSSMHLAMSLALVKAGSHVLIEKPLSHTLEGVEELDAAVKEKGVAAMMAMCYRYHPVFLRVKSLLDGNAVGRVLHVNYYGGHYLPDWHPYADYRTEYASKKRLGGGVVLTSIHSLDNLRWLFGEVAEARGWVDKVSDLVMDVEDLAMAVLKMKSGVYVSWHSDFIQRANQHRLVVTGEIGTIRCDFIDSLVEVYLAEERKWMTEKVPYEVNTMYVNEMRHFLGCIESNVVPDVGVGDGIKTLKLALDVKRPW